MRRIIYLYILVSFPFGNSNNAQRFDDVKIETILEIVIPIK